MIEHLQNGLKPMLWLLITLLVYLLALRVFTFLGRRSIFHPLLLCMVMVGGILALTQQNLIQYQHHVALLHWLLGPATVALAVPLFKQVNIISNSGRDVALPILFGAIVAPVLAALVLYWGNVEGPMQVTMLTKSITTPLAMETATSIGGYPELAAVIVVLTGVVGAVFGPWVFTLLSIKSQQAQGLALGTVAHAVGTAQALQMSEKSGAFATLALCINGVLTAIILPLLFLYLS